MTIRWVSQELVDAGSEAQWTSPHPDCPHPERWHATDAQSTETEVTELVAAFVRALQPDYVVETGSCIGNTTEAIGRALQANGQGRLVSLETDPGRAAQAAARCDGLPVQVLKLPSLSFEPSEPIGFAFFDSLVHLRIRELERYRPWLPTGVIVGFHDTAPHHGYGAALDNIDWIRPIRLRTPRGVTFAEVL
jgi:predicted O-methyltransferase YrrM